MPNIIAGDAVAAARVQLNDPSSQGRWSNGSLLGFLDRASKLLNRDILFPEARWVIATVANQQEYQIEPPVIETLRVYMNGQLLTPTTIQLLEGHQIGLYDQTGTGVPQTTDGIPGVQGTYTPQWIAQTPGTYPVQNGALGGLAPNSVPWFPGRRPAYYWRGGYLGLVPAPMAANQYLILEGVAQVPTIVQTSAGMVQVTEWPSLCLDALVWKMCELAMFSDNSSAATESRNYAATQYDREMRRIRTWNRRRDGDRPKTPVLRTNRSSYITGNNRFGPGNF